MEFTNLATLERLSGMLFFKEDGASSYLPFGNILSIGFAANPTTVDAMLFKRGGGKLFRRDTYGVKPVLSIKTNQFATSVMALLLMGDRASDASQASGTGQTFSFTAAKGQAFVIGDRDITISTVKVGATTKTLGTDYFVDDPTIPQSLASLNGVIILPNVPAGIADADTVDVTYDRPALTREVYNAFTRLNRSGTLLGYLEDETGGDAREIITASGQLTMKSVGDWDPTKFREAEMDMAIFGNPVISARPS